jgi:hypothetical protein
MSGYTYCLGLDTGRSAAEICDLLQHNVPFITGADEPHPKYPHSLYATHEGVEIGVSEPRGFYSMEKIIGFRPSLTVSLDLR